ncbi:MAG TPA: AI-2E family transporter [Gemmatimonadaceae bacterium]|nr:AI-2E family transporter [Gemmatimonadaceae bacterium]
MSTGDPVKSMEGGVEPPSVASPDVSIEGDADGAALRADDDQVVEQPDITKLGDALEAPATRSVGITILVILAILYTLYFARAFVLPIVFAVLLNFLLSPVVRAFARVRIKPPIGALLVVVMMLGVIAAGVYGLAMPVQSWMAKAPSTLAAATSKLKHLREPVEQVKRTAEQVENATDMDKAPETREVVVRGPSLVSRIFGTTEAFLAGMLEVVVLLYFLLAGGDLFLQKLIKVLPRFRDKKRAVEIARETEASISTYLFTVAIVNIAEGVVVAGALYLLHMPNAILWGVLTMFLEFIPYLGALAMVAILALAGLTTFDSVGHALLIPATYLVINIVQANVVSPLLLGNRLTLNPVAIFVGLALWFFLWGIPGAFLAVPLLAAFKIFCDHIEPLAAVGEFLGRRDEEERRMMAR